MAENICSEVAEPAQTSTVLSQLQHNKTKPMQAPKNFNVSHF